jgi:peptidoglycan/LPS O-acetylase OafA/YrhL
LEIRQLTFLRFIAASGVVFFHMARQTKSLAWILPLWARANTAVAFFFVLSGFILAHVYGARGANRAADFYVARLARVAPLYWLALALVSLYKLAKGGSLYAGDLALSALLLQAWWPGHSQILNVPGWSLSVELAFYLCFPFLFVPMSRIRSSAVLAAIAAAVWALNLALHVVLLRTTEVGQHPLLLDFTSYNPLTHLATFVVGIASGVLFDRHRATIERFAVLLMIGSALVFFPLILIPNAIVRFHHNGLFAPVFVAVIWALGSAPRLAVSRVFSLAPLVLLGDASYGIYILQGPVWLACGPFGRRLSLSSDALFWSYFLVLTIISVLCFKWIEVPTRARIKSACASWARRP